MLRSLDLSSTKTLHAFLRRCGLLPTPFTGYVLKSTLRDHYTDALGKMTLSDIHAQGYLTGIHDKAKLPGVLLDTLFPFVAKDIDVAEYHLGFPVSAQEIRQKLVSSSIDLARIPKEQKDLLNLQKKTLLDVITLQQTPLSEFVQVRDTGELMTRDTLDDFIRRNTTTWRGKESVGFKTPGGAILGNLVSYNFDDTEFFPQRSGILTISRVPNHDRVASQLRPTPIVPTHFFRLEYKGHVSFLPDHTEGRVVLGLMKDAFKKGNLYAMSPTGRVRHGRVHKKTALKGTSHSYPDDTFLQRVSGELRALGSTPFLYQFSADPSYQPEKDPYPDEKRFTFSVKNMA